MIALSGCRTSSFRGLWLSRLDIRLVVKRARSTNKEKQGQIITQIQNQAEKSQTKHEELISTSKDIDDLKNKEKKAFEKFVEFKKQFGEVNKQLKEKLTELNNVQSKVNEIKKEKKEIKEKHKKEKLKSKATEVEEKISKGQKLKKATAFTKTPLGSHTFSFIIIILMIRA